ncbi:hypothetical protein IC229_04945 [Spirosoma sp. BT702]|uniref:DUF1080 domain-containing protein n=1 Tax=Spirosoma profusum TaxID=2771354 RepID=A0A926XUJ5_9BACT|nr:hypothetical protein [Spirosoma profusum]MBD2699970.1 hypothetical protein [Spirosoma profusum]
MKNKILLLLALTALGARTGMAQVGQQKLPLNSTDGVTPVYVQLSTETYLGKKSLHVVDPGNQATAGATQAYAKIKDLRFHNGTIELEMAGKPLPSAGEQARGFVGIAFRITDTGNFECIYLRPTNGRAEDQVRRNHSVQYSAHPDFPFNVSRKEAPEKYEAYVDLVAGEWTKVKIVVEGEKARLYVHGATQPTLIVNDLKHGPNEGGAIGLLIGPGTDAHFTNLVVTPKD